MHDQRRVGQVCQQRSGAAGELLAAAVADGDDRWRQFASYGLDNTHRPLGYLAAQASYWWQQGRDELKAGLEG
jgi:gamma-glutamylputrescine oxidase